MAWTGSDLDMSKLSSKYIKLTKYDISLSIETHEIEKNCPVLKKMLLEQQSICLLQQNFC